MREIPFGSDGIFTPRLVVHTNSDLANDLGNLLNRTVAMINQYLEGQIPALDSDKNEWDLDLEKDS